MAAGRDTISQLVLVWLITTLSRKGDKNMMTKNGRHYGLLIPAAMVIGLSVLGWIYLGKDVKRYIRISLM